MRFPLFTKPLQSARPETRIIHRGPRASRTCEWLPPLVRARRDKHRRVVALRGSQVPLHQPLGVDVLACHPLGLGRAFLFFSPRSLLLAHAPSFLFLSCNIRSASSAIILILLIFCLPIASPFAESHWHLFSPCHSLLVLTTHPSCLDQS